MPRRSQKSALFILVLFFIFIFSRVCLTSPKLLNSFAMQLSDVWPVIDFGFANIRLAFRGVCCRGRVMLMTTGNGRGERGHTRIECQIMPAQTEFLQANHSLPLAKLANGWLIPSAKTRNEKYVKNAQIASAARRTLCQLTELVVVVAVVVLIVDFAAHLWVGVASPSPSLSPSVAATSPSHVQRGRKVVWPGPFGWHLIPLTLPPHAICMLSDSSHTHAVNTTTRVCVCVRVSVLARVQLGFSLRLASSDLAVRVLSSRV